MSKILITGATGHLGAIVVENLLKHVPPNQLSVLVRDENKAGSLKAKGITIAIGDYHQPDSLDKAFAGIDKLLLISTSDMNDRLEQHKNVVDAAKKAGVKHIFYTGVSMSDVDQSPLKGFMGVHFQTEDYIRNSGLTYTLLRNGLYADVIPMFIGDKVFETGIFYPTGDAKVAFVVRKDLGEATATIIRGTGHENKTYSLAGNQAYSFSDIATYLAELSGKKVPFISPDLPTYKSALEGLGLPGDLIGFSLGFAAGIQHKDFETTSDKLETFLGHSPTSLKTFLKEAYKL